MHSIRSGFGLRVEGVPVLAAARLALLGPPRHGLAFADRWGSPPRRSGRVLCSSVLAGAWPSGRALGLPWGRPMQIGQLTVASGPAGTSPEAAVLRVQLGGDLLVCALAARGVALPGSLPADVGGADILLLDGVGLSAPPAPDAPAIAALNTLVARGGGVIVLDDPRLAPAIAVALPPATPLYAAGEVARRVQDLAGLPVRRFAKHLTGGGVLLWSPGRPAPTLTGRDKLHFFAPGAAPLRDWPAVPWSAAADEVSLRALVTDSGAKDVVVWHHDAVAVARLVDCGARLWHLVPDAQLPLM